VEPIPNAPDGFESRFIDFTLSVASCGFRELKVCLTSNFSVCSYTDLVFRE
jgi:hypothetical protein